MVSVVERYEAKIDRNPNSNDCHIWTGYTISGYGSIRIANKNVYAHRFGYELHFGPIPKGMVVRHFVCDEPLCQNPEHWRLGTNRDNVNDRNLRGRQAKGESFPHSKLTEAKVRTIRERYRQGGITQPQLASEYGVSTITIWLVLSGRRWAHVSG